MDGLKRIAVNSYKQLWNEEQKREAENFFKNLDSNGDKKVSFEELMDKNVISKDLFYVFNKLDVNGDGTLDFEEILSLYYYKHVMAKDVQAYKPSRRFCKGLCGRLQEKPDFSCFLCLPRSFRRSYHICSFCHEKGVHLNHKHPEWCMLNRGALDLLDEMKYLLFEDHDHKGQKYHDAASLDSSSILNVSAKTIQSINAIITIVAATGACKIM